MIEATANIRKRLIVLACGLVAAACSGGQTATSPTSASATVRTSPSGPAATAAAIGGAEARAQASQLKFSVALTVPPFPVCPLTPPAAGTLTGTGLLTIVVRATADASGGSHISSTIHGHGTATDERGARWVWSDADLNNEVVGLPSGSSSSNAFSLTQHEGFHVVGPRGEQIKVFGTFHLTMVDGQTVVEVEHGNHDEGEICESGFALTPLP